MEMNPTTSSTSRDCTPAPTPWYQYSLLNIALVAMAIVVVAVFLNQATNRLLDALCVHRSQSRRRTDVGRRQGCEDTADCMDRQSSAGHRGDKLPDNSASPLDQDNTGESGTNYVSMRPRTDASHLSRKRSTRTQSTMTYIEFAAEEVNNTADEKMLRSVTNVYKPMISQSPAVVSTNTTSYLNQSTQSSTSALQGCSIAARDMTNRTDVGVGPSSLDTDTYIGIDLQAGRVEGHTWADESPMVVEVVTGDRWADKHGNRTNSSSLSPFLTSVRNPEKQGWDALPETRSLKGDVADVYQNICYPSGSVTEVGEVPPFHMIRQDAETTTECSRHLESAQQIGQYRDGIAVEGVRRHDACSVSTHAHTFDNEVNVVGDTDMVSSDWNSPSGNMAMVHNQGLFDKFIEHPQQSGPEPSTDFDLVLKRFVADEDEEMRRTIDEYDNLTAFWKRDRFISTKAYIQASLNNVQPRSRVSSMSTPNLCPLARNQESLKTITHHDCQQTGQPSQLTHIYFGVGKPSNACSPVARRHQKNVQSIRGGIATDDKGAAAIAKPYGTPLNEVRVLSAYRSYCEIDDIDPGMGIEVVGHREESNPGYLCLAEISHGETDC